MSGDKKNIIIYNTVDGKASVSLYAKDGMVWMNQNQVAELFDTSVPNISMHISKILKEGELEPISVVKDYLTTAADGKRYNVTLYALDMVLAIGFRVRSKRGTQAQMAELFDVKIPAISKHLKNIFESGELNEKVVVSILEHTTQHGTIEGKTQKTQATYYNLDAIIAAGYSESYVTC